jgi:hypothetical protein
VARVMKRFTQSRNSPLNILSPKLEPMTELWTWNGKDWNRSAPMSENEGIMAYESHVRTMPKCPCKLMRIYEFAGN